MRTRLMRITAVVAAFVFLAVVPASAQGQQPVILAAAASVDGSTLFVSGVNFGSQPFLTLDGTALVVLTVTNGSDGDLVTASVAAHYLEPPLTMSRKWGVSILP